MPLCFAPRGALLNLGESSAIQPLPSACDTRWLPRPAALSQQPSAPPSAQDVYQPCYHWPASVPTVLTSQHKSMRKSGNPLQFCHTIVLENIRPSGPWLPGGNLSGGSASARGKSATSSQSSSPRPQAPFLISSSLLGHMKRGQRESSQSLSTTILCRIRVCARMSPKTIVVASISYHVVFYSPQVLFHQWLHQRNRSHVSQFSRAGPNSASKKASLLQQRSSFWPARKPPRGSPGGLWARRASSLAASAE